MRALFRHLMLSGMAAITLAGCSHANAASSPWVGTYRGELPCADCSSVVYTLDLSANQTYTLDTVYQNTRNGDVDAKSHGQFTWNSDKTKLTLSNGENYQLGDNSITMLDNKGQPIQGPMKAMYIFKKLAKR